MYYSYVMGMDDNILKLKDENFIIDKDGDNYMISFSNEKKKIYENFIINYLPIGYWNEYLIENEAVFIFHLEEGFKKYIVKNYDNDEVLDLCCKLCNYKFESIKKMLKDNHFYNNKIK